LIRKLVQSLVLVLTLKCEEAERIRLRASYGEATRIERLAEVLHRWICKACRIAVRQMNRLDDTISAARRRAMWQTGETPTPAPMPKREERDESRSQEKSDVA